MGNTTKQDLVQRTSLQTGTSQARVRRVVDEFLRVVGEELQSGETIELRGFGTFHSRRRQPRPARNPRTGDIVPLAERTVPLFKFSGELRLGESSAPVWELAEAAS
jgi:nucleoid DNA-binding protein